jgi:hypothetical protein
MKLLAISHGCLWQMYQLKKKVLPIFLPSIVEAENFSDHPSINTRKYRDIIYYYAQ